MTSPKSPKDKIFEKVINPYLTGVLQHPQSIEMREGMLHIRDVEGPKKTRSMETRLEAMEQQVFKCQGMVERGLNANHMMIMEFTNKHTIDANDIGKHLSIPYDRIDELQAQIYDLQNQNYLFTVSQRNEDGDIISSKTKDALLSYAQTLEKHSGTLEYHVIKDARKIKQLSLRELELEDAAWEAHYEHELEVKDFLERIEKLKTRVAYLEEELDMGENFHPEGDVAPLISNDEDYEESSTEGPVTMLF
ncbi:40S ribosomal protein S5-1 [Hordeum vulgare]|nr:40S ribosomal protein S5-1 [Hordeum vulgare]